MIILRPGNVNNPQPPFWVGKKGKCYRCGCEFELQNGDDLMLHALVAPKLIVTRPVSDGPPCASVVCPTVGCDNVVSFYPDYSSAGAAGFGPVAMKWEKHK